MTDRVDGVELPGGFGCHVANIGIKDDTDDFVVVCSDRPASVSGLFTTSSFAGPSVSSVPLAICSSRSRFGSSSGSVAASERTRARSGPGAGESDRN